MSYYDRDRKPFVDGGGNNVYTAGTMNHAYAHHSNVAEYQSSGIPFAHTEVISSFTSGDNTGYKDQLVTINFPYVTRWILVQIHDGTTTNGQYDLVNTCRIGFGSANSNSEGVADENYVTTNITNTQRLELKCKKLYVWVPGTLQGSNVHIEVLAGLTSVKDFPSTDERYLSGITSSTTNGQGVTFTIASATNLVTVNGGAPDA